MTSSMKDVSVEYIMKLRPSLHSAGLDILVHQFKGFNECVKQSRDIILSLVSSRF